MDREQACCFTGHRPGKLPWGNDEGDPRCVALKERLADEIARAYQAGCRHFICGMARGADFYFCEAVLDFKRGRPDVVLEAAVPCESQAEHWSQTDRLRYQKLLSQCDYETLIQRHYDKGCMHRRNRYMVDRAGRIIAIYDGMKGGTMYTLNYAMNEGLDVVLLDADDLKKD